MKKALKILGIVLGAVAALLILVILAVTVAEYRPADEEPVALLGRGEKTVAAGEPVTVLSWNIGYGGLSETADFFMDGGTGVRTQDEASVSANVKAVSDLIDSLDADVVFLQEADRNSTRSWHIDETQRIAAAEPSYQTAFANNFKVLYMPYPIPFMGHVDSGLFTLTKYAADSAMRCQLPCPFSWPVRTVNLKRCLLVERLPVEGSDKELVLINLHLEAYDDGEGKIAQTKMLADFMQSEYDKGNYVIAGGDFNQSFSSVDTGMYPLQGGGLWECGQLDTAAFSDAWEFLMDTAHPTCRSLDRPYDRRDAGFQFYMIDGFIVSDNIIVDAMETIDLDFANSDHNPIAMTVTLK